MIIFNLPEPDPALVSIADRDPVTDWARIQLGTGFVGSGFSLLIQSVSQAGKNYPLKEKKVRLDEIDVLSGELTTYMKCSIYLTNKLLQFSSSC